MVRHYNRVLVGFHLVSDSLLGMTAFVLAYAIRFEAGLLPITKGYPPFDAYLDVLPVIGLLVPFSFQLLGCTGCAAADRGLMISSPCSSAAS